MVDVVASLVSSNARGDWDSGLHCGMPFSSSVNCSRQLLLPQFHLLWFPQACVPKHFAVPLPLWLFVLQASVFCCSSIASCSSITTTTEFWWIECPEAAPQGDPPQSGLEKTSLVMTVFPNFRGPRAPTTGFENPTRPSWALKVLSYKALSTVCRQMMWTAFSCWWS